MPRTTGKKKKTTTVVEEIPPGESADLLADDGETSEFDLDLHRADDAETVDAILKEHGISNIVYRFYDNDGGYCYSSPELDYDRARRETRGGKNCKLGIFIGNKLVRMVPFALSPVIESAQSHPAASPSGDISFLKDLLLKLVERPAATGTGAPSITELVTALAGVDQLRGKQESAMDLFTKGLEFAQQMNGGGDWKVDAMRTVRDLAPQVLGVFSGMKQPEMIPGGEEKGPAMPSDAVLRGGIAYLKKKAIAGVDPGLIIDWVVSNAEEYAPLLRVVLNSDFATIAKFDPEIGTEPFASWFQPLFDGLRSEFKQSDTVDNDSAGTVGDASHVGNDGKPGKGGSTKSGD